jgi:hypothetical protein
MRQLQGKEKIHLLLNRPAIHNQMLRKNKNIKNNYNLFIHYKKSSLKRLNEQFQINSNF